jgi:mono/diheme cytochrome c family protein
MKDERVRSPWRRVGVRRGWLLTLPLGLLATSVWAAPGPDAAAQKGKTAYTRYCVSCHGIAAKGDGPLAKDLRVPVPDLTTLTARSGGEFPRDRVMGIITMGEELKGHGSPDMPAWGDAFKKTQGIAAPTVDAAVRNLATYIQSVQAPSKK